MYIDQLEDAEERNKYRDLRDEAAFSFEDDLGFNAWQLSPLFDKEYKEIIGKDSVLGYYTKDRKDFNFIETHLHTAVYLSRQIFRKFSGYLIITDKNAEGIKIEMEGQTAFTVSGIDKQKVGQVAAEIRSFRPPEPYKGKGIRYADEYILKKEGKKK